MRHQHLRWCAERCSRSWRSYGTMPMASLRRAVPDASLPPQSTASFLSSPRRSHSNSYSCSGSYSRNRASRMNNQLRCMSTGMDDPDVEYSRNVAQRLALNQKGKLKEKKHAKSRGTPQSRKGVGRQSYRFVDRIRVRAKGGDGGKGSMSMLRISRKHKRQPDGGHGGDGGSVIIVADAKQQSLRWTLPHVKADDGKHGSSQKKHGRNGKNLVLRVPCGVVVRRVLDFTDGWDEETKTVIASEPTDEFEFDPMAEHDEGISDLSKRAKPRGFVGMDGHHGATDSDDDSSDDTSDSSDEEDDDDEYDSDVGDASNTNRNRDNDDDDEPDGFYDEDDLSDFMPWGEREQVVVADLDKPGSFCIVAKGGKGGIGSSIFSSRHGPLPPQQLMTNKASPSSGEMAALELELKMIADVGLVGFPNAGKSSLLAAMSRATPEIAPYPFTTLHPLVGYIEYRDGFRVCAADVPGLIAGASEGRGKGHDFLRHLERTKALLYIVDAAGVDGRSPTGDLQILTNELTAYADGDMMKRPALLVANKMDLLTEAQQQKVLRELHAIAADMGIRLENEVMGISAGVTGQGLGGLSKRIRNIVTKAEAMAVTEDAS